MSTYPLATLAAQISATGISAPAFEDLLNSEIATEQSIFGADIVLTPDQQEYQLIAARCAAYNDFNQLAIVLYNSILPTYAQGVGLSALARLIGLNRKTATNSTVPVVISGDVGAVIQGGVCIDRNGNLWNLPDTVTIPASGEITVTATAQQAGAIQAQPGDVNQPWTIINGWQSVTNTVAATAGNPVEQDPDLRKRVSNSTAIDAETPLSSIMSAVENITGVTRAKGYENDSNEVDANGIPDHSIAVVVEGGDATTIAQTIQLKKAPGCGTYGSTTITVIDQKGLPVPIRFFPLIETAIHVTITIQPLNGYLAATGTAIVNAIVAFVNALDVGQELYYNWLLSAASLLDSPTGKTFRITALTIGANSNYQNAADIPIQFNAAASCATQNVVLLTQ